MFRILNFYFFFPFFFLWQVLLCKCTGFCWANAVFLNLSFFSCLCFTPYQLCNVASWAVVQSDVQSSKFIFKMPAVTYGSMRIHSLTVLCSSSVELCRTLLMLTMLYPLYPNKWTLWTWRPFWESEMCSIGTYCVSEETNVLAFRSSTSPLENACRIFFSFALLFNSSLRSTLFDPSNL